MSDSETFSFIITFARGQGDPQRIFEAANFLIEGFQELDDTIARSVDTALKTAIVLEDIRAGSLRVILTTLLQDIDDQALRDGEWKKAIGPLLVKGKRMAIEALNKDKSEAPLALDNLKHGLQQAIAETDIKHVPAYAPIHEGRLVASLDRLQAAKRSLGPNDQLTIETEGRSYEVDLSQTWEAAELIAVTDTTERHSEGTVILTIRKADLLGNTKWQFTHGNAHIHASIKDEKWLQRFHGGRVALHSGDAMRCKVRFTYIFDKGGAIIEQRTDIIKVLRIIKGAGTQMSMFRD